MLFSHGLNSPTRRASSLLALLVVSSLAACGGDDGTGDRSRPKPDMSVEPDQDVNTPDSDVDQPIDEPDQEPDLAPDMPQDMGPTCMSNADCEQGSHCDEGVCKPGACRDADKNACGGCAALTGAIGDACGQCMKDQLACAPDSESLVCNGDTPCSAPTVQTDEVANITQYAASLSGAVLDAGDSPVSQHGFCVSKAPSPEIGGADVTCSTLGALAAAGTFTEELSALELGTSYFVRAYATNNVGTAYGEERPFNTADALLPQVQTASVTAQPGVDGAITVSAQIDELGIPAHEAHGVCLGDAADPALGDGTSNCTDLGVAAQTGAFTVDFTGLTPGATYHVRAFARSAAGESYGQDLTVTLRPASPAIENITDGSDVAKVTLSWQAVPGATGYKVYRDGVALTAQPITDLSFDDATAAAGGPPTNVGLNPDATTNDPAKVTLTWGMAQAPKGQLYEYTISAVNDGGESEQSAAAEGARAAQPITGYEVSINGGNAIQVAGLTYDDVSAPAGTVSQANAAASQGTSSAAVFLSLTGADAQPGAVVNYRVRAKNAAGVGQDSDVFQGNKGAAQLTYQWQRSSGTTDGGYSNLPGATQRDYADTGAPANEVVRYYRAVISGGPAPVTTGGVPGFRGANLPVLVATAPTNVTGTAATLTGRLDDLGTASSISPHGYCWSSSSTTPTYASGANNCVNLGSRSATGALNTYNVTGLSTGTRYYVRAYGQIIKGGQPFVVYSDTINFVTRPAAPVLVSTTTNNINHVTLTWNTVQGVESYKIYRNGTLIQTIAVGRIQLPQASYNDAGAPAPPTPGQPASLIQQAQLCSYVSLRWTAAPEPGPGASATYTVVASNASGDSAASNARVGNRAAAPIIGYKVRNATTNSQPVSISSPAAIGYNLSDLRTSTVTAGTVTATDGQPLHPGHVRLTSVGATKTPPPLDSARVYAFNAIGDGAERSVNVARANCNLIIQWQVASSAIARYADIAGAQGTTYDHTGAPDSGATLYYRARVYPDGSPSAEAITSANTGYKFSAPPAVTLNAANQGAPNTALLFVQFRITALGITALAPNNYGVCTTSDAALNQDMIRPGTNNPAVICRAFSFTPSTSATYSTNLNAADGIVRGRSYRVRAYAKNPHTERVNAANGGYVMSNMIGVFIN